MPSGNFFRSDGSAPFISVIIYVYQTDSRGYYSPKGDGSGVRKWQGHLYGWVLLKDQNGDTGWVPLENTEKV